MVVDLTELEFADTSLMLDLVMLARRLHMRGRRIFLRNAQPHIRKLIDMVGLVRLPGVAVEGGVA